MKIMPMPTIPVKGKFEVNQSDEEKLYVDFDYPERDDKQITKEAIIVGLCDVRAADSIKIRYDFERDGYVIYMDRTVYHTSGRSEAVEEDVEVAFIPAWNESGEIDDK